MLQVNRNAVNFGRKLLYVSFGKQNFQLRIVCMCGDEDSRIISAEWTDLDNLHGMTDETTSFLLQAIRMAEDNVRNGGGPFGAIVVKDGKIVGEGVNRVTRNNDPTAHAEVVAIRDACKNLGTFQLTDCDIYTSCEPCPMCLGAIYWSRPAKVYFAASKEDAAEAGFDDAFIYKELELPYSNRSLGMEQGCEDERTEPFKLWEDSQSKTDY